jgi:signal transduction histidine kinase
VCDVSASLVRRLRAGSTWPLVDVPVAAGLAVAAVADAVSSDLKAAAAVLGAFAAGAVALRVRAPLVMGLVSAAAFAGYGAVPDTSTPMWTFLTVLVVAFSVGSQLDGRARVLALAALVAATYLVQLLDAHRMPDELGWAEVWVTPPVLILGPAVAGLLLQRARRQAAELSRLAAELEAERQRHVEAAAEAERNRIARELHDVISHSVSLMVVQAGAAEQLLPADDPARVQIRTVRTTGKEALAELRRQLGVLGRNGTNGVNGAAAPMPGLDDLPRLVSGTGATLFREGDPGAEQTPAGIGLAAYRIVQEALTNAARHAAGAPVRVRLVHHADGLEVDVVNGPGRPTGDHGSGRGLAGMRERVELYGGLLDAGPRDGGWRVRAWLPLHAGTPT